MSEPFLPVFKDLVRGLTKTQGTGAFVIDSTPAGYTAFASVLQTGDRFYYSAIGIDRPGETETGVATLEADGRLSRTPAGPARDFTDGLKLVSLVAAAEWHGGVDSRLSSQSATIGALQAQVAVAMDPNFTQGLTGAVARPVSSKLKDMMSVRDFGALGNGVADDTAAIQKALNAAAGKARLLFPGGTYRIDATVGVVLPIPSVGGLVVPSNSHLLFEPGAKLQVIANNAAKTMALSLYDVDNVIIEGGEIVGDRDSHLYPNSFDTLAALNAGTWRTKEDYGASFVPYAGMIAHVLNDGGNTGSWTYVSGAWSRTGNLPAYITHEYGYGIFISKSRDVWIQRCRVRDCTGDGIFIGEEGGSSTGRTRRIHVSDCHLSNHRRQGISLVQGDDIVLSGNSLLTIGNRQNGQDGVAPRYGIDVESGINEKSRNLTVAGNLFRDCAGGGLNSYDPDGISISNNQFDGCGLSYGYSANAAIRGNVFLNCGISAAGARTQTSFTYAQSGTVATLTFAAAHGMLSGQRAYFEFLDASGRVMKSVYAALTVTSATVATVDVGTALSPATGSGRRGFPANNIVIADNVLTGGTVSLLGRSVQFCANSLLNDNEATAIFCGGSDMLIDANRVEGGTIGVGGTPGSNVVVSNNAIRGMVTAGVKAITGAFAIQDNRFIDCNRGVEATTGATLVRGNYFNNSGYSGASYAILMSGAYAHVAEGNIIEDCIGTPVYCTAPAVISNNRILRSTGAVGIQLASGASGARVMSNLVVPNNGAGAYGVYVGSGVGNARVIANVLSHQGAFNNIIDTSTGAGTNKLANNVVTGTNAKAAGDTEAGTVAY